MVKGGDQMSVPEDNKSLSIPSETPDDTLDKLQQRVNIDNMIRFVSGQGSRLEHSIYNSVDIKWLMDLEQQGVGNMTLTEFLNFLQDTHNNGQTRMFSDIASRKKPVNLSRVEELLREIATYRTILQGLKRELRKERKGSRYHSYAEAIEQLLQRIDNGEKIIDFDKE
jgi:hypothetical protein